MHKLTSEKLITWSFDLVNNTMFVLFILSMISINSCWRLLFIKLSRVLVLSFNHLTNLFFSQHKVSITRLIQLNSCFFDTSHKITIKRNSVTDSSCSSSYKAYFNWFSTMIWAILTLLKMTKSSRIKSAIRLKENRLIRKKSRKRSSEKVEKIDNNQLNLSTISVCRMTRNPWH